MVEAEAEQLKVAEEVGVGRNERRERVRKSASVRAERDIVLGF